MSNYFFIVGPRKRGRRCGTRTPRLKWGKIVDHEEIYTDLNMHSPMTNEKMRESKDNIQKWINEFQTKEIPTLYSNMLRKAMRTEDTQEFDNIVAELYNKLARNGYFEPCYD